ncbi:MAG: TRAFs-binding domain-containing protein [Flavitalea sp.]
MIPQEWLQYAPKPRPLSSEEQWNVFLSYRSVNRTWVLNLYDVLVDLGYKVFIDQCELAAGKDLILRLSDALKKSQAGILIWSEAAAESDWVYKEYERLETKSTKNPNFNFVPIRLDKTELPEFADSKIFVDFSSYPDGPNGGELLRLVHGIVGLPLTREAARFANEQDEIFKDTAVEIDAAIKNRDPDEIIALFEKNGLPWKTTPSLGCKAAESLTKLDKNKEAIDILQKLNTQFPQAIRPKQLLALALARRAEQGDLKQAQKILAKLYAEGERDPETVGIYARTWMDRYNASGDLNDLEQSRSYYAEAFEKAQDDYYTGINAAAKSVFIGTEEDINKAMEYAKKVENIIGTNPHPGDYWKTATVAEILLLQKKYKEAGRIYQEAVKMARTETGSHKSSWKQAVRLMEKLKPETEDRLAVLNAFKHIPGYDNAENTKTFI